MNYRFAQAVKSFVIDIKNQISATAFSDSIKAIQKDYPKDNYYSLQNLMDSHDVDRIASQIVNPDGWFDHMANPGQNKSYEVRKPNAKEILKLKFIAAVQMTMPGAPMIYYGDEAGMWGGDDPDCRKPMVWPGVKYETEVADPLDRKREADTVVFNKDIFNWYKKLISIRNTNKALSEGSLEFFCIDDKDKIIGYKRKLDSETIFIFLNNTDGNNSIITSLDKGKDNNKAVLTNLIDGTQLEKQKGIYIIHLSPYEVKIIRQKA